MFRCILYITTKRKRCQAQLLEKT